MTPGLGRVAAKANDPRKHRKAKRCRIELDIGLTPVEGIVDSGAAGGNCLDRAIFNALPAEKYRIITFQSSNKR